MKGNEATYTIPLRKVFLYPRSNRSKKAIRVIRDFLIQHTKAGKVKLDTSLNEVIWKRGIRNPPRKIMVKVTRSDDSVIASLVDYPK